LTRAEAAGEFRKPSCGPVVVFGVWGVDALALDLRPKTGGSLEAVKEGLGTNQRSSADGIEKHLNGCRWLPYMRFVNWAAIDVIYESDIPPPK
jgi:hypothetical protein